MSRGEQRRVPTQHLVFAWSSALASRCKTDPGALLGIASPWYAQRIKETSLHPAPAPQPPASPESRAVDKGGWAGDGVGWAGSQPSAGISTSCQLPRQVRGARGQRPAQPQPKSLSRAQCLLGARGGLCSSSEAPGVTGKCPALLSCLLICLRAAPTPAKAAPSPPPPSSSPVRSSELCSAMCIR